MKKLLAMATMVVVALGFVGPSFSWAEQGGTQQRTSLSQKREDAKKAKKEKKTKKGKKEKKGKKTQRGKSDEVRQPNDPAKSKANPADK